MQNFSKKKYLKQWLSCSLMVALLFGTMGCGAEEVEKPQPKGSVEQVEKAVSDTTEEKTESEAARPEKPGSASLASAAELQAVIESGRASVLSMGGAMAVYVEDLSDGTAVSVGNQQMEAASLIKVYIAGAVYERYDLVMAWESYAGETQSLLSSMITVSDNDSANELVSRLGDGDASAGMAVVNDYCAAHGYDNTHMGRLLLASNALDDNYTSVEDCGHFLSDAYNGVIVGGGDVIDLMSQQQRTGKIPSGLPQGVASANKTGELSNVENDIAIIYKAGGAYIECVMTSNLADPSVGRQAIVSLTSQVYEQMK